MAGHIIKDQSGNVIHYTLADIYHYRGFTFEFHWYCGARKVRSSDFNLSPRMGRKFWMAVEAWSMLSKSKKEKTRVYG
jgi:hypothetical protein